MTPRHEKAGSALGSGLPAQGTPYNLNPDSRSADSLDTGRRGAVDPGMGAGGTSDVPPKRGRGRPRDPRTDTRILDAAAELIIERGFDGMTVDDVAERAHVGKATVYRRWPSKSDLAVASLRSVMRVERSDPDTGSIVSDLREAIRASVTFGGTEAGRAFMKMCIAESARDSRIAQLVGAALGEQLGWLTGAVEKAIARGEVRDDVRAGLVHDWVSGHLMNLVVTDRPTPSEAEIEELLRFGLRGVLADPAAV